MRLIDADRLKVQGWKLNRIVYGKTTATYEIKDLDDVPTIEAEPIRHGHWIYKEYGYPTALAFYTCSVCGHVQGLDINNYCPNCGAKMKNEE